MLRGLILLSCVVITVGITVKSKFIMKKNQRISSTSYVEDVTQSTAACSALCQSTRGCTAANYFANTRKCHLFNQKCFLTDDAEGWNYITADRQFQIMTSLTLTWSDAKSYCESRGGGLANVMTTADQNMILSKLNDFTYHRIVWVGGSDRDIEGEWVWSNGCRFNDQDFNFWMPGQPDNSGNHEHCLEILESQWNDNNCEIPRNFVCEFFV